MGVKVNVGVGLSTAADTRAAAIDAAMEARSTMDGPADLAVVFASPHHATAAEAVVQAVYAFLVGSLGIQVYRLTS